MRRLVRQQQAVRMDLQSCSLITPARSSVCCNEAQMASSVRWVCDNLQHSLVGGADLVPHCDSGGLEASVRVRSVELYPYVQSACDQ